MATAIEPEGTKEELRCLQGEIVDLGSSYAAFGMALATRPTDLDELLRRVGVYKLTGEPRRRAFDACVDGYCVFHDGRVRGRV